ncbi:DUF4192 domain-containing protein [Actinokineospora sp. HUAS TT18]|uniref:DUF4192 domain-containing protein n=1 Tax=Actinokineospora sp. HUAS TT18 TaxID=3447451 RepID=UPI003F51F70A
MSESINAGVLDLTRPGSFIADVPVVLGYYPTNSLIVVIVADGRLGCCVRATLSDCANPEFLVQLMSTATGEHADHAAILVVGPRDPSNRALVDRVESLLATSGVETVIACWAPVIERGQPWEDYRTGETGTLPDPASSPLAAHVVANGRVIYPSERAILDVFAPDPADALANRERHIDALRAQPDRGLPGDAVAFLTDTCSAYLDGTELDDQTLATVACVLAEPGVRDACLLDLIAEQPTWPIQFWTRLTQATPGPARAFPAVMAGLANHLQGEGVFARIAFQLAQRAEPGNVLAELFCMALSTGLHPDELRTMLAECRDLVRSR